MIKLLIIKWQINKWTYFIIIIECLRRYTAFEISNCEKEKLMSLKMYKHLFLMQKQANLVLQCHMKCYESRPGFELVSLCPFPTTITITLDFGLSGKGRSNPRQYSTKNLSMSKSSSIWNNWSHTFCKGISAMGNASVVCESCVSLRNGISASDCPRSCPSFCSQINWLRICSRSATSSTDLFIVICAIASLC